MQTKRTNKIVKFLLAGIVGIAAIFAPLKDAPHQNISSPVIYATGENTVVAANDDVKKDLADILEIILKVIYIFLWPFIALAGLALDNGMVYGSYFQLDSALFTFWNIMKNFANFALGFLFLWSILKYIFNFGSKAEDSNPMKMITKLLMAGIGIQASRFIMGGLIDLSTVATVGVGGLPLQLLKEEPAGEKPLFGIKTNLKISDIGDSLTSEKGFVIFYTYPTTDLYYLPCAVKNSKLLNGSEWMSVFTLTDTGTTIGNSDTTWEQVNQEYCMFNNDVLNLEIVGDQDVKPGSQELKDMLIASQAKFLDDNQCVGNGINKDICQNISNIATKGKGYQGAFHSLYGSLLNLGSIHVAVNKSEGSMTMEAIIKTIIGLAYLVPLMILCVVLIMRIGVLWISIAFSPIIVLSEVFDFGKKMGKLESYTRNNVISMIFLPVIVTFAISITIVFLSVLSEGLTKGNSLDEMGMNTTSEGDKTCINLLVTTLCIDNPSQDIGVSGMLDFFPWFIMNIFGIGLMRTIVMAALGSNKFTGEVVGKLNTMAKNAISAAPVIPIPGGGMASYAGLKGATDRVKGDIDSATANSVSQVISPEFERFSQKTFSGRIGRGQRDMTKAAAGITDANSASQEIARLMNEKDGVLHNDPNAAGLVNNRTNNMDLADYGKPGLDLVNKIASTSTEKLGPYSDVESAFKDGRFLSYLARNKSEGGLGRGSDEIKSFYSGRENRDDIHKDVMSAIEQIVPAASSANASAGVLSENTYTDKDGTIYTMTSKGISEVRKDKSVFDHDTPEKWKALVPKLDKETMKKMKESKKSGLKDTDPISVWINTPEPATTTATAAATPASGGTPAGSATTTNSTTNNNTNNNNANPAPVVPPVTTTPPVNTPAAGVNPGNTSNNSTTP